VILIDFHGTISERHWEEKVIFPYVKLSIGNYLRENWYNDSVQHCFIGLRNESFEQRFRNKLEDAPVISDVTADGSELDTEDLVTQVSDFLLWQMNNKRETRDTQTIERLIWRDGLKKQKIKVPVFDDVLPSIQNWRAHYKCRVYIISSLEEETLRLLFKNTDKGNLDQFVDGYLGSKRTGEKIVDEIYQKFYEDSLNKDRKSESSKHSQNKNHDKKLDVVIKSPPQLEKSLRNQNSSESMTERPTSASSETNTLPKPILFLTDSGQEAKVATRIADGRAYECLLVTRPGNRKIRTYYLSQYSYIEKFTDIQFVNH